MTGTGDLDALKLRNRAEIVDILRADGPMGQAELVRRTGLSRSTVSSSISELRTCGLVVGDTATTNGVGRPSVQLSVDHSAGPMAGIEVGHHHLRVAVGDLAHRILVSRRCPLQVYDNAPAVLAQAVELVRDVVEKSGWILADLLGVGVSLPGPMDRARTDIGSSTVLPGWGGVAIADQLHAALGVAAHVDNDAAAAAVAESVLGAGRGVSTFAFLKAGSGLGAGLFVEGRAFRGSSGSAGELGHVSVDPNGRFCYCGNRGCLQTIASGQAIVDSLSDVYGSDLTVADVVDRCRAGELVARRAVEDAGAHIGAALANLCNLMNPELIVVGGQLSRAGSMFLAAIRQAMRRGTIQSASNVKVVASELAGKEAILGALCLVPVDAQVLVRRHLHGSPGARPRPEQPATMPGDDGAVVE